jgi:hypothetical protein
MRLRRIKHYRRTAILSGVLAVLGSWLVMQSFAANNPNLTGDLNADNAVTISDLSILLSNFGKTTTAADLNDDGNATIADLSILLTNFGKTYTPPTPTPPAPTPPTVPPASPGCNNFCSNPTNPIYQTEPVSIDLNVNTAWCGPTWDAPQEEFDLARQKLGAGAILMPPCKKGGGYFDQTPEQYKIELDKAQIAGLKVLVLPGYTCGNAFDHNCYLSYNNPDAAIDKFASHPALAGLFILDEPPGQEFPGVQRAVERMRIRRPGLLAYTNLYGGFGTTDVRPYYGTGPDGKGLTYDQYISYYIKTVKTTALSFDDYSSPENMEKSMAVIERWAKHYQANGRPELASRNLWSAVSTIGGHAGHDLNYFNQNRAAFLAINEKYGAKTLYFTWRSPPADDVFTQPATGPALCGLVNNAKPGTMCGN